MGRLLYNVIGRSNLYMESDEDFVLAVEGEVFRGDDEDLHRAERDEPNGHDGASSARTVAGE